MFKKNSLTKSIKIFTLFTMLSVKEFLPTYYILCLILKLSSLNTTLVTELSHSITLNIHICTNGSILRAKEKVLIVTATIC